MRVVAVAGVLVGVLVFAAPVSGGASRRETASGLYLTFAEAKRATHRGVVAYGRRGGDDHVFVTVRKCGRVSRVLVGCRFDYGYSNPDVGYGTCPGWLMRVTKVAEHRYQRKIARKHECEQDSDG